MKKRFIGSALVVASLAVVGCQRAPETPRASSSPAAAPTSAQRVAVTVDDSGYHPSTIAARAGSAMTLVFTRTSDEGCGDQIVLPSLNIRRPLPLNQPVEVALNVPSSGSVVFTCGMNMYRGSIVVQ